jgi:hypothetical protein
VRQRLARLRAWITAYAGQCSVCSGWFDNWPGGVCDACRNNGN